MAKRKYFILLLVMVLTLASISTVYGGKFIGNPSDLPVGGWFEGNTPSNLDPNKPVLLFVHGLNSDYSTWTDGSNSMYNKALSEGYQTVFINLHPDKNMWTNGALLATKIQEIYNEYNKKIVIVSHSKGGLDTQSALIHYNAHPYVSNVITLGSPHYGSQLADLAYSSWASWLGAILGQKNDATESLQTGYMSYFRSVTDSNSNRLRNNYYTFAGTSTGSFFSALYWGGLYLSSYGPNDGAVVVNNAYLPYGNMVRIANWDHYNLTHGNTTFDWFKPYLTTTLGTLSANDIVEEVRSHSVASKVVADTLVRGNLLSKETSKEVFFVEEGVDSITINFISNTPIKSNHIRITSPDQNKKFDSWTVNKDQNYFKGAYHHTIEINNPMEGEWSLEIIDNKYFSSSNAKGKNKDITDSETAYLMTVTYQSDLALNIPMEEIIYAISDSVLISDDTIMMKSSSSDLLSNLDIISKKMEFIPVDHHDHEIISLEVNSNEDIEMGDLVRFNNAIKNNKGILNITLDISGFNNSSSKFQRTVIKSIFIDDEGNIYY
ncbi:esterase/lipase family protein [Alkaliphilus transvaalensis]|uniref:esterase/lipase family protein n=1 Tax=Alkaliphilus transvaalensis TaxID=114628 RepID=UPI0006865BE0|nr:hypothetical protein [Alkaliphilus transvaalensis]